MSYLFGAGLAEYYRNYVETKGSVIDTVSHKKITSGLSQPGFFGSGDNGFSG